MKNTLEKWIPIILAGQEPDGYMQTAYTLRDTTRWKNRWEDRNRYRSRRLCIRLFYRIGY